MPFILGFCHWSRVCQVINTCLAVVVLSYIFFDLLDLDGSNFYLRVAPDRERTLLVAEAPEVTESTDCRAETSLATEQSAAQEYCAVPLLERLSSSRSVTSPLLNARAHGFRLGLPRSSPPG
jgi:hypothetical protein